MTVRELLESDDKRDAIVKAWNPQVPKNLFGPWLGEVFRFSICTLLKINEDIPIRKQI